MVCVDVFSLFERPDLLALRNKQTNFIMLKKYSMKKLFILITALLLPLFAFEMSADDENAKMKIPLELSPGTRLGRSLTSEVVECYFFGMMSTIQTIVLSDLGDVSLTVTNCSTGEVWYDIFDSAMEPQNYLPISGSAGIYEVVYITESGNVYEGTFTIQ